MGAATEPEEAALTYADAEYDEDEEDDEDEEEEEEEEVVEE